MEQIKQRLNRIKTRLDKVEAVLATSHMQNELRRLEQEASKPDFWNDPSYARSVMYQIDGLKEDIELLRTIRQRLDDAYSVLGEESLIPDLQQAVKELEKMIADVEIKTFLSGKYDKGDAILSIHAGQGGTEAMDWANMLLRMYLRYIEQKGWRYTLADQTPGEEAGIKSATLIVEGRFAYGYLKGEAGTHRLVRQSPFNADRLRQTSFALVEVMPRLPETGEIKIKESDLEWQFFRASTQGGQNVQKVSTAVRLIHKPTGITVVSQQERTQEQNRKIALELLRAKLWAKKEAEREAEEKKLKGQYRPASWGTQIRSYVLHPYKMVKDLRTGVESSSPEDVLDGNLDPFIEAELKQRTAES